MAKSKKKTSSGYVQSIGLGIGKSVVVSSTPYTSGAIQALIGGPTSGSPASTNQPSYTGNPHVVFDRDPVLDQANRIATVYWSWNTSAHKYHDHYVVKWWYYTPANGQWEPTSESTTNNTFATYPIPATASLAKASVKAVQKKKYKGKDNKRHNITGKKKWTCAWATSKYVDAGVQADIPTAPDIKDIYISNGYLHMSFDNYNYEGATIYFEIIQEDKNGNRKLFNNTATAIVSYGRVSVNNIRIEDGYKYYARCKACYNGHYSNSWGNYSDVVTTAPPKPENVKAETREVDPDEKKYRVLITWDPVDNVSDVQDDKYQVSYTQKQDLFDTSTDDVRTIDVPNDDRPRTSIDITLPNQGAWYFRVRGHNLGGDGPWSDIVSASVGLKPEPPTTWTYTSNVKAGEPVIFNWTHNSADGSKQSAARLWVTLNGEPMPGYNPKELGVEKAERFDTSNIDDGATLLWKVATKGAHKDYSDASVEREVKVHEPPTVSISLNKFSGQISNEEELAQISKYPVNVSISAGPTTQKLVSMDFTIIADDSYASVDETGGWIYVSKGDVVYSKRIDDPEENTINFSLTPGDVNLVNDINYIARAVSYMSSALTGTGATNFHVAYDGEDEFEPHASVEINFNTLTAKIYPYCTDEFGGEIISGGMLAVYRLNYDGTYTEIASGIEMGSGEVVLDRHPTLDYARYRVVATSDTTGRSSVSDISPEEVNADCIVLNWMEDEGVLRNTLADEDDNAVLGDYLRLPYNVDVSDSNNMDVALIEYIGREHPVSYYGTQKGYSSSWKCEIRKDDIDSIYALRRLARYAGDVYVREPNGSGYWAQVKVQYSINHKTTMIPVSLNITRVEGGM